MLSLYAWSSLDRADDCGHTLWWQGTLRMRADPLGAHHSLQETTALHVTHTRPFHTLVSMTSDPLHELLNSSNDTFLFRPHFSLWRKVKIFSAFGKLRKGLAWVCYSLAWDYLAYSSFPMQGPGWGHHL